MLWRRLGRKIFRDKRHIGITLYSTTQCDTGCAHCLDNSDCKSPVHFTKELAQQIIEEARREKWMLSVLLTGGGEPLMTPDLVSIVDAFYSYERLRILGMVTSGFLENELLRKERLSALLSRPYANKLLLEQSFSLYHESFPQRLENMFNALLEIRKKAYLSVRTCMSLNNFAETQHGIEKVVSDVARELGAKCYSLPLGWEERDRRLFHHFNDTVIGDRRTWKMYVGSFLTSQFHVIKTKKSGLAVRIEPISLEKTGRGEKVNQAPFGYSTCDAVRRYFDDTVLIVGPDGSVYPDCSCYPTEHMRLGKIGETSLVELVRRKDVFAECLMGTIISDSRMCEWGTGEVCELCKKIVAEKGLELK